MVSDVMEITHPSINWNADNLDSEWTAFENHAKLMCQGPLADKSEKVACACLLIWVGAQGREIFSTFELADEEKDKIEIYFKKFRDYAAPKKNQVFSCYVFQKRDQNNTESTDKYITELKILVKPCGYLSESEMVRDKIVSGVRNPKLREKLLAISDSLTLAQAVTICRAHESTQAQLKTFEQKEIKQEVDAVAKSRSSFSLKKTECYFCGGNHSPQHVCPAKGKTCAKCKRQNHFAKVCKSKAVDIVGNEATNTPAFTSDLYNQEETEVFLYAINKDSSKDEIFAEISVCGQIHIDFKIDTGAQVNILPSQYLDKLSPKPKLLKAMQHLTSYCGSTIPYVGVCNIPCHYKNGPTQQLTFYVVESNTTPIIGFKASKDMNLIKLVLNIEESPVSKYSDVFKGIGKLETECEIYLKDNATPTVHPARKIPLTLKQKLKTELERLESLDIIEKVSEPTDWVNDMVMVEKKDGGVRLCINPVDVNKAIKRPYYPVPSFDNAVAELDGAAVFSRLDACSGYWILPLSTRSSYYTTFSTIYSRYRWKRYPFSLVSAQDEFQRKMEEAFEGLEGIRILVDDILVYGKNREEHDQTIRHS